jgi:hypothetical protein
MNELELLNNLKTKGELVLTYLRINQETPVYNNNEFGQDIEPSGEYISYNNHEHKLQIPNWEYGKIKFVNPLIVEHINTNSTGWKLTVSKMFKNKKKKALSNVIIKAGYDAIITIDSEAKEIKEIVNLKGVKLYD